MHYLPNSVPDWFRLVLAIFLVATVVLPLMFFQYCLTGSISSGNESASDQQISEVVESMKPHARYCYDTLHTDFDKVFVEIALEFEIVRENDQGRVQLTELDPRFAQDFDRALHDCLSKELADISVGGRDAEEIPTGKYTFVFNP